MAGRGSRRRRCRRRKSTSKQGGNGDAHCPPHPGFVCAAMEEDAEGAGPGVSLARCPSGRVLSFLGHGATKEGGAKGGASGKIRGGPTAVPASTTSPSPSTSIPRASDLETLLRARKLSLILDLDHTLLNSVWFDVLSPVEQANGLTPHAEDDPTAGIFRLVSHRFRMLAKLRPFARSFLEQASAMFEMSVYTLGEGCYARAVVKILDPDGAYFGGRVVSRDESTRRDRKSLDVVPGADAAAVVILDDSGHVWPEHLENLILMDRYLYFADSCQALGYRAAASSLAELRRDEPEQDGPLAAALQVLTRVHRRFFDSVRGGRRCPDVREVIRAVRREALRGCTVAFSWVIPLEVVARDLLWKVAEQLGAVCVADADATVTHVVALDPWTDKARWARENGKYLVNHRWILVASFRWCRPCEQEFPVTSGYGPLEYLDQLKYLDQLEDVFHGVAVDGSSSCVPGQAEQEEEEGAFEPEDDDIDQSPMSTNSRKRTCSTSTTVRALKQAQPRVSREEEDVDLVFQILKQDGIRAGSDLYNQAVILCMDALYRRAFMAMETKEERLHWIRFNWEDRSSRK